MMSDIEAPPPSPAETRTDAIALAEALHTILVETSDAEATRTALSALLSTRTGRDYMAANPLGY